MKFKIFYILLFLMLFSHATGVSKDASCAVVLSNGAKYSMEVSLDDVLVRKSYHRKIKILTEEGLKYAAVIIPYYRFVEYTERVGGINVTVQSGEPDSHDNPVVRRMDKESIEDVRVDFNYRQKRFIVPDVKPGDIIDVRYDVIGMFPEYAVRKYDDPEGENFFMAFGFMTKYGLGEDIVFPKWNFQEDIPVVESRLEVSYFNDYRFGYVISGGQNVTCTEQDGGLYKIMQRSITARKTFSISTGTFTSMMGGGAGMGSSFIDKSLKKLKFEAFDMPAFVEGENYVINPQKNMSAVDFDFKGRRIDANPRAEVQARIGDYSYADSWTDVSNTLFNSRYFGRKIFFSQDFYKDYADSVSNLSISDYEKVQMICTHIRNDIECSSKDGGMFISSLRDSYNNKAGSNVDICAITYKTLEKAGFSPKMVMLKSRDKGYLYNGGISVGALNNAILYIGFKDGRKILFDPTGNPVDTRMINPIYLVKEGIVYNNGEERINLMNAIENKEYHNAALFVEANGMVSGNSRSIFINHSAYEMEGVAPNINAEEGEVKYGTLDSLNSQYTREFNFTRTSAIKVDDKIFINPFAEKYFNAEEFAGERTYPVEFRNPKTIEYTATIYLPEDYEVYDLPQKISLVQPNCGAKATILCKEHKNMVQVGLAIEMKYATIPLEQYKDFQQWWMQMCSLFDEMIVLRKKGGKSFTDTEKMTAAGPIPWPAVLNIKYLYYLCARFGQ